MDSTTIPGNEFLDILFYGRNKDYGAYELRSRYDKRVRNAIIGTASIMLVMIGGYVLNTLKAADNSHQPLFVNKETTLNELKLPDPDPIIPPPPVVKSAPPPAAATVEFTPPKITDKPVDPDEMPPAHKDMQTKVIGFENTDGVEGGVDPGLDPRNAGTGVVAAVSAAIDEKGPVTFVDFMPEFPGGEAALMKYLGRNTKYPPVARENEIQGTVFIQFVVNRDGSITDVKITGAPKGGGLEEEAIRVVSSMPTWKPGRQNGQNVAVFFNLPIKFTLNQQ